MMREVLSVKPTKFRPSIPNLVYQYDLYTNYNSKALDLINPEIDADEGGLAPAHQGLRVEHADDKMVLPTHQGGKDVPMYSEAEVQARLDAAMAEDPNSNPPAPEVLSPAVQEMMARREAAGSLKKALEGLTLPVESSIKARCKLAKAETDSKEAAQAAYDAVMAKVEVALSAAQELAVKVDGEGSEWQDVVKNLRVEATSEMRTKKALMSFTESSKKQAQGIFKLQKAMLADIKSVKAQEKEAAMGSA